MTKSKITAKTQTREVCKLSRWVKEGDTLVAEFRYTDGTITTEDITITSLVEMDGETKIPFKQHGSRYGKVAFTPEYYPKEFYIHYEYNQ